MALRVRSPEMLNISRHVIAESKGGLIEVSNLRTCCAYCNHSMGNCNMYVYIKDNKLRGPGKKNVNKYLKNNPSQVNDVRTKGKALHNHL